tara:strand:- start:4632 stop:5267 length:636 start_codon:yes stop_codon:yes gene_type:complete
MESRSIARELSLLLLGQMSENQINHLDSFTIEKILNKALESLMQYWRDELDLCANYLELAKDELRDSELKEYDKNLNIQVRVHLNNSIMKGEDILNSISETLELTHLLFVSDQETIRLSAIKRVSMVLNQLNTIDSQIDKVMEGWRFKRLPRIDRDILRLAFIDLNHLQIPIAVACNEAVNLANRYSDEQGRKMINGILRKLQKDYSINAS